MIFPSAIKHLSRIAATLTLAISLTVVLAACGSDEEASAQETTETAYTIGEPLEDTTYAAIVTSEYGSDTLQTSEFREIIDRVTAQMPQLAMNGEQSRELRKNIVEDFVLRHALFGEAERLGVTADSADVQQRIGQIKSQFPSEEAFQQALAADNISEEELRGNIEDMLKQEQMLNRFAESVAQPAESDIEEFREERAQQIRASHILFTVSPSATEAQRDSVRELAEAVLDSVESGESFADLARRHSEDGTAQMGGDLGFFSRGQMVEPFEEAAFALADSGAVTDELVETRYGYHIIQLTGRQVGEKMDTSQARQLIVQERQREAVEEEIENLREKVVVRINPEVVDADLNAGRG